jgi:hypothetical protein
MAKQLRCSLRAAEDSSRLERPYPVMETQGARNGLGESSEVVALIGLRPRGGSSSSARISGRRDKEAPLRLITKRETNTDADDPGSGTKIIAPCCRSMMSPLQEQLPIASPPEPSPPY